ncbi:MAG TPA: hypothetical protein VMS09_17720 [Paenibacillus sp.]|uniref:hypothetical protein n=1 Tax=Paenibacillus sp. TaxID=58172 RepID=UPI002CCB965F|nr:hypothetical protein [Paenibacillus sp.]HUC93826.1 hypothetical protein [Paenibacillus sp.]
MNMTLKKVGYLLSALLAITLVITWTMNIQVSSRSVKYNTNPDLSSKFVASENFIGNKIPINTLEELTNLGDVIIRGTVISDNKEVIVSLSDGTTANLEQKFNSKYPDKTFGYNVSVKSYPPIKRFSPMR